MRSLLRVVIAVVKWTVIIGAYLVMGVAKLVTIVVLLLFVAARGGVRRLLDAKERSAFDDGEDEYDLGYPSPESYRGRSSPSYPQVSRDDFDARWQRERDLRVAEQRVREYEPEVWAPAGPSDMEHGP